MKGRTGVGREEWERLWRHRAGEREGIEGVEKGRDMGRVVIGGVGGGDFRRKD